MTDRNDQKKELIYVSPFLLAKMPKDTPVLLAFSGGADSSALLHLLYEDSQKNGFRVYAAHFNHKIRGEEAERDMLFCRSVAEKYGITFFCGEADVPALAKEHGNSLELEARECRYAFFADIMKEHNIPILVTAHHANDRAESLMLHLLRGSGLSGLRSIEPQRSFADRFTLVRPLIYSEKQAILNYCIENNIEYVTDSTNSDNTYMRNAVRSHIIPEILAIRPEFVSIAGRNCDLLAEDENYLLSEAAEFLATHRTDKGIPLNSTNEAHPAVFKRAVRMYFSEYSDKMLEYTHINSIYALCRKAIPHSRLSLPDNIIAKAEQGCLIFERRSEPDTTVQSYLIPLDKGEKTGDISIISPCPDMTLEIRRSEHITEKEISELLNKKGLNIAIDCDKISDGMFFRNRRPKDRVLINGINKKVKKLMCDSKLPQNIRDRLPMLCNDDEILWIPMLPPCDNIRNGKITKGKSYLIIKLKITTIK